MSTIASPQPTVRRRLNLRAFLAGGTATAALIAAAVVVFGSLAAYVAFEGSPVRGDDPPADSVTVGAPKAAAATLGRAGRVVAARPAASTPIAPPPTAGVPGATAPGTVATATGQEAGTVSTPTDLSSPTTGTAPTTVAPPAAANPTAPDDSTSAGGGTDGSSSSGPVGGVVDQVDNASGDTLNLGETTAPVTGAVDETLNQAGGAVDNIGSQVTGAAGAVLGGG
jgi:hypothetical protein